MHSAAAPWRRLGLVDAELPPIDGAARLSLGAQLAHSRYVQPRHVAGNLRELEVHAYDPGRLRRVQILSGVNGSAHAHSESLGYEGVRHHIRAKVDSIRDRAL